MEGNSFSVKIKIKLKPKKSKIFKFLNPQILIENLMSVLDYLTKTCFEDRLSIAAFVLAFKSNQIYSTK